MYTKSGGLGREGLCFVKPWYPRSRNLFQKTQTQPTAKIVGNGVPGSQRTGESHPRHTKDHCRGELVRSPSKLGGSRPLWRWHFWKRRSRREPLRFCRLLSGAFTFVACILDKVTICSADAVVMHRQQWLNLRVERNRCLTQVFW